MRITKVFNCCLIILLLLHAGSSVFGQKKSYVVSLDGKGDFKTVQQAIDAVPDYRKVTTIIYIKNGVYKEKLNLSVSKKLIKLIGETVEGTVLTYDDYSSKLNVFGEEKGTSGSASFYIYGDQFTAENITFQNSSGPVGQAVALLVAGDRAIFKNCRLLGFQDTLYTYGGGSRQYYLDCYIEGTVDFIFGSATAVFENCEIFCKKGEGYISASSAPDTSKFGHVFLKCKITGDALKNSYYLGRPWRPYGKAAFLECVLGKLIRPEGWNNWDKVSNEQTAYYAEYNNTGSGAEIKNRIKWSYQLTKEESLKYTLTNIFKGWDPNITYEK